MEANLCKCNKCDLVMIDQNPKINAPVFDSTDIKAEMTFIDDKDGGYWACPICLTDENLSDVTEYINH